MLVRRIGWAGSVAAVLAALAFSGSVLGQAPDTDDRGQPLRPDEMIEAAIKKIETGELQAAWNLLLEAKRLDPGRDKILLAEGLLAMRRNSGPEAIKKLGDYNAKAGAADYRGYAAIGRIYQASGMFKQAVASLEKARDKARLMEDGRPVKSELALDLATVLLRLKRNADAAAAAREAASWAPDDTRVQLRFGQIMFGLADYAGANAAVERSIGLLRGQLRLDPLNREYYYLLHSCYQLVLNLLNLEMRASPEDGLPLYKMALAKREATEVGRSLGLLDAHQSVLAALEKQPEQRDWQVFAARLEAALGAMEAAGKRLDEVLRSDPDHQEARQLRERVGAGSG